MARKAYTQEQKASILAFAIASGYPVRKGSIKYTVANTGICKDPRVIGRWYKTVDRDLIEAKVMELKNFVETELTAIFGEMDKKREGASYRDLTTAAGILTDKLIVLEGGVTGRTESISGSWKDMIEAARNENKPDELK